MAHRLLKEVEALAKVRREDVSVLIARALEVGLDKIRQETILEQYLKGEIKRERAIRLVGLDVVKLAERQRKAVQEDIKWGLQGA